MREITLYQFLVPLLGLVMIGRTYSKWQHKQRSGRELLTQVVFWGALSFASLYPQTVLDYLSRFTGIKNGIYALVFFSLLALIYAVLVLYMKIEHLERDITDMVRKDAVEKLTKKH